jgi:hypothetical protein
MDKEGQETKENRDYTSITEHSNILADHAKQKDAKGYLQQQISNSDSNSSISGSCVCGSVRWESAYPPSRASFCYCRTCSKISGGAFIAFMDLPASSVAFLPSNSSQSSTFKLMAVSKSAERGFCSACGSTLTMRYFATPETLYLTMASADEKSPKFGAKDMESLSKKHIYVRDKVGWYTLPDDGLPRFETMPNEAKYLVV